MLYLKDEDLELYGGALPAGDLSYQIFTPSGKMIASFPLDSKDSQDLALLDAANKNNNGLTAVLFYDPGPGS